MKWNTRTMGVHPNAEAACMAPEARRLAVDVEAARKRKRTIVRLSRRGWSAAQIAELFGISRQRTYQLLKLEKLKEERMTQRYLNGPYSPDDTPIKDFPLGERSLNCLRNENLTTAGAVRKLSDQELLRYPNIGRVTLREIRRIVGPAPNTFIERRDTAMRLIGEVDERLATLKSLVSEWE